MQEPEIEITPEMIEAGANCLCGVAGEFFVFGSLRSRLVAESVFAAMEASRQES